MPKAHIVYKQLALEYANLSDRAGAFRIQALLRLLQASGYFSGKEKKILVSQIEEIKILEDTLGHITDKLDILSAAKKLRASKEKTVQLKLEADAMSQLAFELLKNKGWLAKDTPKKCVEDLDFLKKLKTKKEIKIVAKGLRTEIDRIEAEINKKLLPAFATEPLTLASVENYFHRFRRQLRWIAIYYQSLPKLFTVTKYDLRGLKAGEKKILKAYRKNKFANPGTKSSLFRLDRYSFYLLTHYIAEAETLKDRAEIYFKLRQKHIAMPFERKKTKSEMAKLMQEFRESKLLKKIRHF